MAASERVGVRPAQVADVPEIARIQLATWSIAYGRFLPQTVLARFTIEDGIAQWTAAVTEPPTPMHRVLVAYEHETAVGFVAFGPSDDEDSRDDTGTIVTMLVEPRWGRRGHGSRMLAAATDLLREDGLTHLTAWVYDRDPASREFYVSAGWETDGVARILDADSVEIREVRLHTDLPAEPTDI